MFVDYHFLDNAETDKRDLVLEQKGIPPWYHLTSDGISLLSL